MLSPLYSLLQRYTALIISNSLSILLVIIRIISTSEVTYLFMVWNVFLAIIPFAISALFFNSKKKLFSWQNLIVAGVCIIFLPNAPYMITDLFHLRYHTGSLLWYDTLLIASFAWNGLLLFFYTLNKLEEIIRLRLNKSLVPGISLLLILLCSFGIYLGRYLRFNSWDIISDPFPLAYEISNRFIDPFSHQHTWSMTLAYFAFLAVAYFNFKQLKASGNT